MKKILILSFFVGLSGVAYAQDIEVKKFEPLEKDQTATLNPRKDINGTVCGLVKVLLKEPGAEFEGNVMGEVQFTGSEYLVYLPNGTKRLGIKHPDYLPTTIVFADYGIKRIESSITYGLKVLANKKKAKVDNSKKGMSVFNVKPSNAMLLIDGQIADGSGGAYTLSLPFGTHYYTVKLKDFSINNQIVQIDKNAKNINVDLTEYFAKVDVSCKTEDAEILINNEQKGFGKWGGMMIPGKYTIEVQKDGCHPQSRQIELKDNDVATVDFSALKTITGSLRVDYEPAGADVLLNGKKVGVTPFEIKDLPVGDYQLEIWKEYYVKKFSKVQIREDQEWAEKGSLQLTHFGEIVRKLSKDKLAEYYRYGYTFKSVSQNSDAREFITCANDSVIVPFNPVKAIPILKEYLKEEEYPDYDILGPCYPNETDDRKLSFCWAINALKEYEEYGFDCPYAVLAWHYFYGIGCEKNLEEAKRYIRLACPDNQSCPAFKKLITEMGLGSEFEFGDFVPLGMFEP